jgi:hypothetical protein
VTPVTKGWVFGVLAIAEPDLGFFRQSELLRPQPGSLVRAIAHRLMTREPTGAPPVVARLQFNAAGFCIEDFGEAFVHVSILGATSPNATPNNSHRKNARTAKNSFPIMPETVEYQRIPEF